MNIGFTYNLKSHYLSKGYKTEQVAEFDCEETLDAIETALNNAGHRVARIGCLEELLARLVAGERWDMGFNIAEGLKGSARESQIPAMLEAFSIPHVFSDAATLAFALDKSVTDAIMKAHRVPTADFAVIRSIGDCDKLQIPFPLFLKPVSEGTSRGVTPKSVVHNAVELKEISAWLLDAYNQPVLAETYLSGREFTVGLLGDAGEAKVLGVMEVGLYGAAEREGYTYENKQKYEDRVSYKIVDEPEVADIAARAWTAIHGLDAGRVDVRMDADGRPRFMEVNPLAGLNPRYSDLCILCRENGIPYGKLINSIVNSCARREKLPL